MPLAEGAAAQPLGRLVRKPARPIAPRPPTVAESLIEAAPPRTTTQRRGARRDTSIGGGRFIAAPSRRGLFGLPLQAELSFVGPDTVNAGVFYAIDHRWTVGVIGQRLVHERATKTSDGLFLAEEKIASIVFGPSVQFQVTRERRDNPAIYLGAYALEWGTITSARTSLTTADLIDPTQTTIDESDDPDTFRSIYVSIYKSLPWFRHSSFVRHWTVYGSAGYGARTGRRFTRFRTMPDPGSGVASTRLLQNDDTQHSFVGWLGTEITVPLGIAAYGELVSGDGCDLGYVVGLRWRSPVGITLGIAYGECLRFPAIDRDIVAKGSESVVQGGGGVSRGGSGRPQRPSTAEDDDV